MRYVLGFVFVLALGLMGCSETSGTGGSAGDGGVGGDGGSAGIGGTGGIDLCEEVDCYDDNDCTEDVCDPADGTCSNPNEPLDTRCGSVALTDGVCDGAGACVECNRDAQCDDFNDCTTESCDSATGVCSDPTPVDNGTECAGGTCQDGACELSSTVLPCTEQGIRNAIAAGDDVYTFDCDGPHTVTTMAEIVIDNDVILDGEANLTVDGDESHAVFSVPEGVTAVLRRLTVSGGLDGAVRNSGTLSLIGVTVSDSTCGGKACLDAGVVNSGTGAMTLANSTVSGNPGGVSAENDTTTTLVNSTVSGNVVGIVAEGGATLTVMNSTISGAVLNMGEGILTVTRSVIDGECGGALVSNGYNIESPGDFCGFDHGTDLVTITEGQLALGELANNGGPTMTHALGAGSVAIDHVPAVDCGVTTDQRGQPRPETGGDACDVGSFERQPEDP